MANKLNNETEQSELITSNLAQINRKLRLFEERIDNLRNHLEMIENNLVETNNNFSNESEKFNRIAQDLRQEMQENSEKLDRFAEHMEKLASIDSVRVLERYVEILNPLKMLDKDDVEEMINEKMKRRK